MVELSKAKRKLYGKAQAVFWKYAGSDGDKKQEEWFKELLEARDYLMLTAIQDPSSTMLCNKNLNNLGLNFYCLLISCKVT